MVRMKSKTVFAHDRITIFADGGPAEGVEGGAVAMGQEFEADVNLAKELDRLGHAEPLNRVDLEGEGAPLEPHYTVSVPQLQADQAARAISAAGLDDGQARELPSNGETIGSSEHIDLGAADGGDQTAANLHEGFGLGDADDLDSKTPAELRDIAEAEAIDLGELKRKDAIVAAIRAARSAKKD